ncbi:hypothetical protein FSY75_32005, partial [Streptomyces sp. TR1341]|nr:hypothetical protein [Streptomyces sp. TR1341]
MAWAPPAVRGTGMEPTESVAPDSRLRLRRRALAWREILRPGRAGGRTRPRVRPAQAGPVTPPGTRVPL